MAEMYTALQSLVDHMPQLQADSIIQAACTSKVRRAGVLGVCRS